MDDGDLTALRRLHQPAVGSGFRIDDGRLLVLVVAEVRIALRVSHTPGSIFREFSGALSNSFDLHQGGGPSIDLHEEHRNHREAARRPGTGVAPLRPPRAARPR